MRWIERALDTIALTYAVLSFTVPLFWLAIHPAIRFWRRFGNRSLWVGLPVWLLFGVTLIFLRGSIFSQRLERNAFTVVLGLGLLALACRIDWQVRKQFGLRRLLGIPELEPHRNIGGLVHNGIYARVRHPRYLAFMLTFWSLAFLTSALGVFVLAIVSVLMYLIVAPFEERELRQQYGPNMRRTARWCRALYPGYVARCQVLGARCLVFGALRPWTPHPAPKLTPIT